MSNVSVVIIGAGLGGLCLAHGLRRAGVACTVYERDPAPAARRQGYRLHVDGDGDDALARTLPPPLYQLLHATAYVPRPETTVLDHRLIEQAVFRASGGTHLAVDRVTLRQILLAELDDVVVFGKALDRYAATADDGGTVVAHFTDGTAARGTLLVGADGVSSAVRRQYLPHARVVDTGLRQLYGRIWLTPETRPLFDDRMFAVFTAISGPHREYVGLGPVQFPEPPAQACARLSPAARLTDTPDYVMCSFGARRERFPCDDDALRAMSGEQLRAMVRGMVADWHPRVQRMIEQWDAASIFPLVLRTSVPIAPWPTTNVTLVGDAAHAMSPAGGVGANTALRDAARLAHAIERAAGGAPLRAALAEYEAAMIEYGFAAVRVSAANGARVLGQDPLPAS